MNCIKFVLRRSLLTLFVVLLYYCFLLLIYYLFYVSFTLCFTMMAFVCHVFHPIKGLLTYCLCL